MNDRTHANDIDTRWLKVRDVSKVLGVSERTVTRYANDGALPAYRLGPRELRFKAEDVDQLLVPISATE